MMQFLYTIIAGPFILFGAVVKFLVWEFLSDGRWKTEQKPPDLAHYWQGQVIEARRQFRELDYKSRRQLEESESKFRKELKRKERETSSLRS